MRPDSAVSSAASEASQSSPKSSRWDKKIASIGFGIALVLAIVCFAILMNSDQQAAAHVDETTSSGH